MSATSVTQEEQNAANTKAANEAYDANTFGHSKVMGKIGGALQGAVEKAETLVGLKTKETKERTQEGNNHGVIFGGAGNITVGNIPYPKMELPWNKQPVNHGAIVKVLTSALCGSDLHPYRGRTTMKPGLVLGHEFTGEIVELGSAVQHMKVGDWGIVPFNVACGTCACCKELQPHLCERSNHERHIFGQGGIYGYVCGGDWQGGQAEFAFVPYVDYNFIRLDDKALAKSKLLDLTLLTDVLPTAFHGTEQAQVGVGQTVYIAGAGPIGLTAAAISRLKGALHVIVGDFNHARLELARRQGCLTIDLNNVENEKKLAGRVKELIGSQWVDCTIECVGYEARDWGSNRDQNNRVSGINSCIELTRPGGHMGLLGVFFAGDPKAPTVPEKAGSGSYNLNLAEGWMKGIQCQGGQAVCMRYISRLMKMILANKLPIASMLDVKVMPLNEAPKAYEEFSKGSAHKYIFDPHNTLAFLSHGGSGSGSGSGEAIPGS